MVANGYTDAGGVIARANRRLLSVMGNLVLASLQNTADADMTLRQLGHGGAQWDPPMNLLLRVNDIGHRRDQVDLARRLHLLLLLLLLSRRLRL